MTKTFKFSTKEYLSSIYLYAHTLVSPTTIFVFSYGSGSYGYAYGCLVIDVATLSYIALGKGSGISTEYGIKQEEQLSKSGTFTVQEDYYIYSGSDNWMTYNNFRVVNNNCTSIVTGDYVILHYC